MPLDTIHDFNCQLLAPLPHQRYQHEPILDYATDERVRARFGWQAVFSKTLFLKFKDGRFALLLTHQEGRLDNKAVKAALGAKPSICTAEEMQAEIGCLPGAVCPFLPRADIPLLVDSALLAHDAFTWTPGHPEQTFLLETVHLAQVLEQLPCLVSYLPAPSA
ncbi:YbaK/EbsC family protein [Aeromonas salmonicida]|uniref:YbaK/EbsC family protein n=1 Tax=Aeromonas salmonicida TaxID=645 RepID=UPI00259E2327|nr:YbaK/EbsC family protein [Aeromonas salmonicida]MDM5150219.1 YbaK/EbsC family protein [Aeromonas salmonicida]